MTIQNTTSKVREDGNGVKSVFSFPFRLFTDTDIEVSTIIKSSGVTTLKVLNTDYTVQINAITEGGTITYLTTVPSALEEFFAVRVVPDTQPTDIPNVGSIREEQIETPLDRRTMISQQQQEALDRTLKFLATSEQTDITVPEPEANKALFWNVLATALENRSLIVTSGTFPGDFSAGLDANKAASPSTNDLYLATDTFRMYRCFSSGVWSTKQVFSDEINLAKGADIASAATTDIGVATGNFVHITGNTTITGFGTIQAGTVRILRFAGALILTHNATSLILPTAANITTATDDVAVMVSEGTGNWRCVDYQKADGTAVGTAAASAAEVKTGTEAAKYVAPSTLISHEGVVKAWITFNGAAGPPSISSSFNVDTGTGITDNGAGDYTIPWDINFSGENTYAMAGVARVPGDATFAQVSPDATTGLTAGVVRINCISNTNTPTDCDIVTIIAIGSR